MASPDLAPLVIVVVLAVVFDFINGFHDTANAVATVISTRVMKPGVAIGMAAVLNFAGALFGTEVAKTVGSGIVGTSVPLRAIAAALVAAIAWNLITWYRGIPSSSSHALVGSLLGSGAASLGVDTIRWSVLWGKVALPLLASPIAGFLIALWLMRLLARVFESMPKSRAGHLFRVTQLLSAAFMAFSHGGNDAQKTMGIITLALVSCGVLSSFHVPVWVIALSAGAMAAGTFAGGQRIIRTMGSRLVHLEPVHGFAAETSAAAVIQVASRLGFPLSTTHVISASILGVGASRRVKAVRWAVASSMVNAWLLTIPVTAVFGYVVALLASRIP